MRKRAVLLVLLAVFCTSALHVLAQERSTLPELLQVETTAEATAAPTAEATPEATPVVGVPPALPDLVTLLQNDTDGRFTTLVAAIKAANLGGLLGSGTFTLLAPTNDAFTAALTQLGITQDQLFANKQVLTQILLYHLLPGQYFFRNLTGGPTLSTELLGQSVTFNLDKGVFTVNGAGISSPDNLASNGIMHVLDTVMLPPQVQAMIATPEATAEPTAAPTAEATAAPTPEATPEATPVVGVPPALPDLVTLLQNDTDGRFTTLVAAIKVANLGGLLGSGTFTLLAPTNDAFTAALTQLGMTQDQLFANKQVLTQILLYHLLPGQYFFRNLTGGPTLPTELLGQSVTFNLDKGVFTVNGAGISSPDNLASNGIMHVLDTVMLPPQVQAMIATPEPTAEATAAPTAEPTAEATAKPTTAAYVRAADFAADGAVYEVYVDTYPLARAQSNGFGDWVTIAAGKHDISVGPVGSLPPTSAGSFDISDGGYITLAVTGSGSSALVTPLVQDFTPPADGQARLSVFNAIPGSPPYDIVLNGRRVIVRLGYPGSLGNNDGYFAIDVPAGTYHFEVAVTGAPDQIVVRVPEVSLEAGKDTFVAVVGSLRSPSAVINVSDIPAQ